MYGLTEVFLRILTHAPLLLVRRSCGFTEVAKARYRSREPSSN